MKKAVYLLALLLFAALHFSCQKGEQLNHTRVKGIVVDGNDNPTLNAHLSVFGIYTGNKNLPDVEYLVHSDANGEFKFDPFRAQRNDDYEYQFYASGPTAYPEYKSMNWWNLDVKGYHVLLHKGRDYKIKVVFR